MPSWVSTLVIVLHMPRCVHGHCLPATITSARAVRVAGVPKSLFGFDGTQLVGRPLSSVIDIFKDCKKAGAGDELSLLELLVAQMLASTDPAASTSPGTACASWRVGVHQPSTDGNSTTVSWHRGVPARAWRLAQCT